MDGVAPLKEIEKVEFEEENETSKRGSIVCLFVDDFDQNSYQK
jgi:hypothetical protein